MNYALLTNNKLTGLVITEGIMNPPWERRRQCLQAFGESRLNKASWHGRLRSQGFSAGAFMWRCDALKQ
jgi:hypothetical protein